jgi:hypothetical protein
LLKIVGCFGRIEEVKLLITSGEKLKLVNGRRSMQIKMLKDQELR